MQHPFDALAPEYANLLARMKITRQSEVTIVAGKLLQHVKEGKYAAVSAKLGIPQIFIATSFERESSSNFNDSPAQGDPWNRISTHVPRGRGPFKNWADAADDAYTLDGLDKIGAANWTWPRFCYEGELFNGFGYRSHGIHTPYDWAGTNDYSVGKYVADGVWSGSAVDQQLGIVPVARMMASTMPELDIPGWPTQTASAPPIPAAAPIGVGGGAHDTAWRQTALNKILGLNPPLTVDNSYGRRTKYAILLFQERFKLQADGLSGPLTDAAIEKALEG